MALAEKLQHNLKGSEVCQGREGRRQKPPPPKAFFRLFDEEDAELVTRPGSVTDPVPQGRGRAAHRGAQDRGVSFRSDLRCSCIADGGSGGGPAAEDRHGVKVFLLKCVLTPFLCVLTSERA